MMDYWNNYRTGYKNNWIISGLCDIRVYLSVCWFVSSITQWVLQTDLAEIFREG